MASTSRAAHAKRKPDVFVNFRGKDTRNNFIGHLCAAMERNGIFAYTDHELRGGEEISPTLSNMISESQVSVVVFSPNYADSRWCLDELVQIMQRRRENGQTVLPVFLQGVKPTHVRHQTGPLGQGFKKLVARGAMLNTIWCSLCAFLFAFIGFQTNRYVYKKEIWRKALEQTADLSSGAFDHSSEEVIIKQLVRDILSILGKMSLSDYDEGFFGAKHVRKVESILFSQEEKSSIGIWGMGGSGKTTLAQKIRDRNFDKFNGLCFIQNVGEDVERGQSCRLQQQVLSQLLGSNLPNEPPHAIYKSHTMFRLSRMSVLVILDDVNDASQIKAVIGDWKNYGTGSKMIAISRDKQVLKNECDAIYEVQTMDDRDSLQLLKYHMFKQREPSPTQMELLNQTIKYAQGLPLALVVLGRSLYDKDITIWRSELAKLNEFPTAGIMNVLRSSFDRLDEPVKKIFLDIACLLHSWQAYSYKFYALAACGFCPISSIDHLIDKALITVSSGRLQMHCLLRQIGNDISKESRLWRSKEIADVLLNDVDSSCKNKIEVISSAEWPGAESTIELKPDVFKEMRGLRILRLISGGKFFRTNVLLPQGPAYLHNELKWFEWESYPCASLPPGLVPENLVEFRLQNSNLIQLWSGKAQLPNLKSIDVYGSKMLVKLPDFSGAPKLARLQASACLNLEEIPNSVQHLVELQLLQFDYDYKVAECPELSQLTKLEVLSLEQCGIRKLPQLPPNLHSLNCSSCENLGSLPGKIGECWNLLCPPTSVGDLQSLVVLDTYYSGLNYLLKEIRYLTNLKELELSHNESESLSEEIKHLVNLKNLNLSDTDLKRLPEEIKHLTNLIFLDLSYTKLDSLPEEIKHLTNLEELCLFHTKLESLPKEIGHLSNLNKLCLFYTNLERLPKEFKHLANLEILCLSCTKLKTLPDGIRHLVQLKRLFLSHTDLTILPEGICNLANLITLDLFGTDLESLPEGIKHLTQLKSLYLSPTLLKSLRDDIKYHAIWKVLRCCNLSPQDFHSLYCVNEESDGNEDENDEESS